MGSQQDDLPIVAIGASAGGLEALREVFTGFRGLPQMAFVVVQHLDPNHDSLMAQLLERYTDMAVTQAAGGEQIEANHIYVIPPGHGLAIENGRLRLTEFTDPRGMRRPIDDFFESLANDRRNRAACVILSGTGGDGSRGLRAIKEHGGLAVVQDPSSARYDGMPVSAIGTGLVDLVLPPPQVIEALRNFFDRADVVTLEEADEAADHIDEMCRTLREAVGHDFSGYKRSTLSRRIARRMQVLDIETSKSYLARLRSDAGECQALFRDLLINVTRFFRDRLEFDRLNELVIEPMIAASRDAHELRVWVAGCSSGEEAYSIAMLIDAAMRRQSRHPYVQIFATDIDDQMLDLARSATYPISALPDIPSAYHANCVSIGVESFSIAPRIRDMVRFSSHNLVRDPPYSKVDLVACRNLLIYFDDDLQRQVMPAFHFALNPDGKLFLGSSETIGRFEDLFTTIDQRARIFARRDVATRYPLKFTAAPQQRRRVAANPSLPEPRYRSLDLLAMSRVAERYASVSMLVDSEGTLLNKWGDVGRFMNFPDASESQLNAVRQARSGLSEVLGPLLRASSSSNKPHIARDVTVTTAYGEQDVAVVIEPIGSGAFLVVLRETGRLVPRDDGEFAEFERGESEIQFLQDELQGARLRLRTTVEELETANEELKSSNEEMMSMNEELQSTNEELTTVNDELKAKVDQVTTANADLKNFFDSTDLVVIVVDRDLRVRSATDVAHRLFPAPTGLVGTPLSRVETELEDDRFLTYAMDAAKSDKSGEYRAVTKDGLRQFVARITPYRLLDGAIAGATLVFTEVTHTLELEEALAQERVRLRMALDVAQIGVWEYEPATGRTVLDEQERRLMGVAEGEDGSRMDPLLARLPGEDRDRVNSALRRAMDGKHIYDETFRVIDADGTVRWLHGLGRKLTLGETDRFIGVTYDVTREQEMLAGRELMLREMNHRVKNLFAIITAMIKMTSRNAESIERFSDELCERVYALGRSHSLTVDRADGSTSLDALLRTAIEPSENGQAVELEGDEAELRYNMVTPLAMIFHEWVTNSCKYGALSVADGRIDVNWTIGDDGRLAIEWVETGKSGTAASDGGGFGKRLIAASAQQIGGQAGEEPTDAGYRRTLTLPLNTQH